MRYLILFMTCFCWTPCLLRAQEIRTVVPSAPVIIGTAFQVQFVITDPPEKTELQPVNFDSFLVVSGPNIYEGKSFVDGHHKKIRNIAYTLVPISIGRQKIKGILLHTGDSYFKSNDVSVIVVSQPAASFNVQSSYTDASLYAPSSKKDLDKLIEGNLFLRTEVSKKQCLQGEPVVATFKLYSRLQSSSEVIKSPGFYGFTAVDMLDINKPHPSVESVGDKVFNVSILRKVQLYPVQSGKQMIDPMNVRSEIEFRDSLDPERRIVMNKEIQSAAVVIDVKPLPGKRPDNFSGPVGRFFMEASLPKNQLAINEEGKFFITIKGSGDFIQAPAPVVEWPGNIDVFELPLSEQLKKEQVPLTGERTYSYSFTASKPGDYVLPPVVYSFFDPVAGKYQMALSDSIRFSVSPVAVSLTQDQDQDLPGRFPLVLATLLTGAGIILFIFWKRSRARNLVQENPVKSQTHSDELEALPVEYLTERESCIEIRRILYDFLRAKFNVSSLRHAAQYISTDDYKEVHSILQDCELVGYSSMEENPIKESMKQKALTLLKRWEA